MSSIEQAPVGDTNAAHSWAASRPKADDVELGLYLRLHAIQHAQLPEHPDLPQVANTTRPDLTGFMREILEEAHAFAISIPGKFRVKDENKQVSPSTARVQLSSHEVSVKVPAARGEGSKTLTENWFARISKHENAAKDGTATWEEFDAGLRDDHSVHEMEYTPDLKDAHLVLDWRSQLASLQGSFGEWKDVHAEIREMLHQLPPPLSKRCFSVLVISGTKADEFIDVQLPLELRGVTNAKYVDAPSITEGIYVSVEYGKLFDAGTKVEWRMATASDARGVLPMWAQKLGLPGAIAKDVGLFMDWRMKQRKQTA